ILIVGMGMPRQEIWVYENRSSLSATVILTAGACMDYIAGAVPVPPRWLGPIGLEWAYRLATNPRRLATRYLLEPWALAPRLVRAIVGARLRRSRSGHALERLYYHSAHELCRAGRAPRLVGRGPPGSRMAA